jgi:flagellar hook-basal body complex protein FliE
MEGFSFKEVIIAVIVSIVLSQIATSFQRRSEQKRLDKIEEIQDNIVSLNDSSQSILLTDDVRDSLVAKLLEVNSKRDSVLLAKIDSLEQQGKKYVNAIEILEDDLKRNGFDYSELPDF